MTSRRWLRGDPVFTVRGPFKRVPCFHWHGDVRAAKDFSLSSANCEGYGPGTASSFRRGSFLHSSKRLERLPRWSHPGAHRGLKRETFHDGPERGKVARDAAAAAAEHGASVTASSNSWLDARPLLRREEKKNMLQPSLRSSNNPGFKRRFPAF